MPSSWYPRYFHDEMYDENGIYIPRLHGKPWQDWYTLYGCTTMKEIIAVAKELEEEKRLDIIGSNGNTGDHYE